MDYRLKKFIFFFLGDAVLIGAALIFAFLLRFDGTIPEVYLGRLPAYLGLSIGITLPVFILRRLYSFTWVFVSLHEILELVKAVSISALIFTASYLLMRDSPLFLGFPRSILIIEFALIFLFAGTLRASKRILFTFLRPKGNQGVTKKTLIIGAEEVADQLLRTLLLGNREYTVIGILDDAPIKQNTYLHGIPILGPIKELPVHAARYGVETIIIAIARTKREVIRKVFDLARSIDIQDIKIVPSFLELVSGAVAVQELRSVNVEDLLGREQAKIDTTEIEHCIKGKDILITGAAGSIGSELCRQVCRFSPHSLHMLDYEESNLFDLTHAIESDYSGIYCRAIVADIRNTKKIEVIIKNIHPHVIFHAAAYKHVPLMETFPEEAVATNVLGTLSVAQAALNADVEKFVLISTDKAVRPVSIMGQTKKIAEMIIQTMNGLKKTQFVAVRFGNVLGSRGSVIPLFEQQLKRGGPITITDPNMTRFFMTTPEAALLVLEAGAIGQGGEIFVLDMGEPVKIVDLARELIKFSGLEPDEAIKIVFTKPRPGEKIAEEVLTAEEGVAATRYQKIFRAKTSFSMTFPELLISLQRLKATLVTPIELRSELNALVGASKPMKTLPSFETLRYLDDLQPRDTK